MKKFIEFLLGLICISALCFACSENTDGSCNFGWTISCLAVFVICGVIWSLFFGRKTIHITGDVYDDLNRQVREYAENADEGYKEISIVSGNVRLLVGVHTEIKSRKFTDDAWGATQIFKERSRCCGIAIINVMVWNKRGDYTRDHDFDIAYIETKYEFAGNIG